MRRSLVLIAAFLLAGCASSTSIATSITAVPWLPLPRGNQMEMLPSPSAPLPIPPGTPPCRANQLEGELLGTFAGPNTPIAFRNTGATPCFVNGVPAVAIVDSGGTVIARDPGVGTQFDPYIAAVDVLMTVGTPPLRDSLGLSDSSSLPQGQAFVNVKWTPCVQQTASQLRVDLQNGAGRFVVPFSATALKSTQCQPPLVIDPFKPTGVPWPPAPDYLKLQFTIDSPKSAHHGSTLHFYVSVKDLDSRDYGFTPCPDYSEALVPNGKVVYFQLNCGPAGTLKTGQSVTFEMKFEIPDWTQPGSWNLLWGLLDGRTSPPSVITPITIS